MQEFGCVAGGKGVDAKLSERWSFVRRKLGKVEGFLDTYRIPGDCRVGVSSRVKITCNLCSRPATTLRVTDAAPLVKRPLTAICAECRLGKPT